MKTYKDQLKLDFERGWRLRSHRKKFEQLSSYHQELLSMVVPALQKAAQQYKGTQAEFAAWLGVPRTTVSHLVNCMKPSTKTPHFRSVQELLRLRNNPKLMSWRPETTLGSKEQALELAKQAERRATARVKELEKQIREEALAAARAKKKKGLRLLRQPKLHQVWADRDPRRPIEVKIVAVHTSKIKNKASVTYQRSNGRQCTSRLDRFLKRFEYRRQSALSPFVEG